MNMGLFKSRAEKELDSIIQRLEMDMANNYKDNAQRLIRCALPARSSPKHYPGMKRQLTVTKKK